MRILVAFMSLLLAAGTVAYVGIVTAAPVTYSSILVSDGMTPVPLPDGSGAFVVPPAGVPLPLIMAEG